MKTKLVLIKFGGSLITNKQKAYTPNTKIIKDLVRQIKEALTEDKNLSLIIGNGGGSFAHYPAVKYKMQNGIKTNQQKYGFCQVQDGAASLNRIIVKELLDNGVKACSLQPSSMIVCEGGKVKSFFMESLIALLKLKIVPVLYGDIVLDKSFGSYILSTEELLTEISVRLKKSNIKPYLVIHNGLTQGVMDEQGKLISSINQAKYEQLGKIFYQTKGYDVTGGMLHKVKECLNLSKFGIKSLIINGTARKNLLKKAILGQETLGTIIE